MSIVSNTTVHECDCCHKQITIHNEREFGQFEELWYAGLFIDFCTICQVLAVNQVAILKDRATRAYVLNSVERLSKRKTPASATAAAAATEVQRAH